MYCCSHYITLLVRNNEGQLSVDDYDWGKDRMHETRGMIYTRQWERTFTVNEDILFSKSAEFKMT
jgi:hypothetical protein